MAYSTAVPTTAVLLQRRMAWFPQAFTCPAEEAQPPPAAMQCH